MIPAGLWSPIPYVDPCGGAPTLSTAVLGESLDTCAGAGGYVVTMTVTLGSGSVGGSHELRIYRKVWDSPASEPGTWTYFTTRTDTASFTLYDDLAAGSDGGGASVTKNVKGRVEVVPTGETGPACDELDTSAVSETYNECTI